MEVGFLQETKSILRSLVLSSPNGMTQDRLNRDYREVVGSWIPFQKLGFPNMEMFLRSIPDTLVVTGHGREARIGFVSNEKLQHMNEMVSRQKNTTRDRKSAVLHVSSNKSRLESARPSPPRALSIQAPPPATTYCTFNRKPQVYSKSNNNSLYISAGQKNLPQTTNKPNNMPQEKPQNNNLAATKTKAQKTTETEYTKRKVFYQQDNKDKPNNNSKIPQDDQGDSKINNARQMLSEPNISKPNVVEKENNTKNWLNQENNSKTTKSFQDQLSNSKNVLEEIKFPCKAKSPEQKDDTKPVQLNTSKKGSDQLPSNSETHNHSKSFLDKPSPSNEQANRIKAPVIKHVESKTSYSQNISASKEVFKHPAPPQNTQSRDSSFNNSVVKKNNTHPFLQTDSSDNDIDEAVPEFAANNLVFRVDFPENTVAFGRKIPDCALPKELKKGAVVGVFISEIHSPFKFWFHIYKDNHELDILMNRIESFYSRVYDSDLVIPKTCLAPGQVCAALFNDMWHRAEILTNICNNKVKVHFVDYGTVSEIETQNIKYLPTIFANTPVQAIRGSLSHIKPISPLWPKRAIREFLSMVSEVLLYAQIIEVDEKEKTAYMVLCDTNSGATVQINKELVDRGFAKLDSEWDEKKIAKNGYRKRHPREIFPTFEMLETGEYPSLFELEQLLAQGIDYEKITEKIILSKINNSNDSVDPTHKNTFSFNLLDTNPFKSDIISEIVSLKIFDD